MKITGEMQIYLFHRKYLGISAACRSTLHSEARAEGRFPQGDYGFFPDSVKSQCKSYRYRGLSDSGFGGRYCSYEDEFVP